MGGASRYAAARLEGGGPAIATVLYDGKPNYRTIFIARNGLSIKDFPAGARNHSLVLTHRNSTTGWLVPFPGSPTRACCQPATSPTVTGRNIETTS